jgi:carboxyl-terminal processing protease
VTFHFTFVRRSFRPAATLAAALAIASAAPSAAAQDWRADGLAAFDTVWRTVHETHYDPAFGGLDWEGVRTDLRPRVERAASADEQRAVIRDMLGRLGQSHFALLTSAPGTDDLRGPASVPFDVRLAPAGLLVTRMLLDGDGSVAPGDAILRIDGQAVAAMLEAVDAADPRRSELSWRRAMAALSGPPATRVRLTLQAPGSPPRDVDVTRVVPPGESVSLGHLPVLRASLDARERTTAAGRRVGVIRFNIWMAAIAEPFAMAVDRFRRADGLVIDLRGNPGGLADMIRGIAGHFVDEPMVLGRMRMRGLDLEFRVNPRRSTMDGRSVEPYAGPVAILVDELTASASECFAGGLQALGRARVFGTRSSGQALPASTQQLRNGDVLLYAIGDFVTSTGHRLEGTGVIPDVEVPVTPEALAAGHDAEFHALEWIERASLAGR